MTRANEKHAKDKKKRFILYNGTDLEQALFEIRENKLPIRAAARRFRIPRTTLQDRIHQRTADNIGKFGPCPVLSAEEENKIKNWLINLAKCGFPQTCENLLKTVQDILQEEGRKTPFKDNKPGKKWYYGFMRRHPDLTLRTPETVSKSRAQITEEGIRKWFRELKEYLTQEDSLDILEDSSRIFNADETGFSMAPKTGNVIAPKGIKNLYEVKAANEKENLTVLMTFSADGRTLPPMVVLPYKRSPNWLKSVQSKKPEWVFGKTESGWMRGETFLQYVKEGLNVWISKNDVKRPVLFFVDGHASHMSLELSDFCSSENIILYALPPNTTHILQPADVGAFKGLKSDYKNILNEWRKRSGSHGSTINKESFCDVLDELLNYKDRTTIIQNAFKKCGLFPFDPNAVDYSKCIKNALEALNASNSVSDIGDDAVSGLNVGDPGGKSGDGRDVNTGGDGDSGGNLGTDPGRVSVRSPVNDAGYLDFDVDGDLGNGLNEDFVVNFDCDTGRIVDVGDGNAKDITHASFLEAEKVVLHLKDDLQNSNIDHRVVLDVIRQAKQKMFGVSQSTQVIEGIYEVTCDGTLLRIPQPNGGIVQEASLPDNSPNDWEALIDTMELEIRNERNDSSEVNASILQEISSHIMEENTPTTIQPHTSKSVENPLKSPSIFEKFLKYPKPIQNSVRRFFKARKPPMSISSQAWKTFQKNKEDEKKMKTTEVEKRKLERQKKREGKKKTTKRKKTVPKCPSCNEDVLTDVEEEGLKNIGCDNCENWFHLQCTNLSVMSFADAELKDFICPNCDKK